MEDDVQNVFKAVGGRQDQLLQDMQQHHGAGEQDVQSEADPDQRRATIQSARVTAKHSREAEPNIVHILRNQHLATSHFITPSYDIFEVT